MLDVLLESRSHTPRRLGGTMASAVLHAVLVSAAVALARPSRGHATPPALTEGPILFVPPPPAPGPRSKARGISKGGAVTRVVTFRGPDITMTDVPPIDLVVLSIDDGISCDACKPDLVTRSQVPSGLSSDSPLATGILDEREVDRSPRLIGHPAAPRYPAALRESGVQGAVVVQLVVDTLGRVDMSEVRIIHSAHALLTDAVQEVLPRYRFVPGEAGGRRVSTRVQIPFEFRLR